MPPFPYLIDAVKLSFRLHPTATRVTSRIRFRPNPATTDRSFFLHGEGLTLIRARIDGKDCAPDVTPQGLTLAVPDAQLVAAQREILLGVLFLFLFMAWGILSLIFYSLRDRR